jgi:hypothetical protein
MKGTRVVDALISKVYPSAQIRIETNQKEEITEKHTQRIKARRSRSLKQRLGPNFLYA